MFILKIGYYADPAAQCQAFHVCIPDGLGGLGTQSFLCPNGTIFNQQYFICDWWFNFDCSQAQSFYSRNDEIRAEAEQASLASASNNRNTFVQQPNNNRGNGNNRGNNNQNNYQSPSQPAIPVQATYGNGRK